VDCERARRAISERMDGERLSPRLTTAVERHVAGCTGCAAFQRGVWKLREAARFEVAPAVPDLVDSIMASVQRERQERAPVSLRLLAGGHARRPLIPGGHARRPLLGRIRLAPVAAALAVGLVAGSLAVGGPWQRPEGLSVDAAEVTRGVAAAAPTLSAYQARFAVTEHNFAPDVPIREFSMNVWFQAPEQFRLDVVDHTQYPSRDVRPNDLELIVNGSSWYSYGPSACPIDVCPPSTTVLENRVPFSTTTPAPTDLILPVTSLADAEQLQVVGRGTLLGRPAIQVRIPFDRATPLFPFLSLGGSWRPFFGSDQVDLWLDAKSWFPLSYAVYPARGRERDQWALRFGLPSESPRHPIFQVVALSVDRAPPAAGTFRIPRTKEAQDLGANPVSISRASEETGWKPVEPEDVEGLDLYQVVLPPASTAKDKPRQTITTYAKGLAWLKVGESRGWTSDSLYGSVSIQAEKVTLSNGGVAYYEPATIDHGRRLAIHTARTDLYVETNLPRDALLDVSGSLPVTGVPIPADWAVRRSPDGVTERVTLAQAATEMPFAILLPASEALPAGYEVASAEMVRLEHETALNVYFQQQDTDLGTGPIRLHEEVANELPPPSSAAQSEVEVRDAIGRWTADRHQLEWVEHGVYYSLDAGGLSLADLLVVAASLEPSTR
jgi:outer membrane lipoprotein-sorting protein